MLASTLVTAAAAIVLVLGTLHLAFTFRGPKFDPRDPALKEQMQAVSPRISSQTTMWRAWVGFNASHSYGAMLFGWLYGYFALVHAELLFRSPFLLGTGVVALLAYCVLGRLYWFSIPYRGLLLATGLFVAGAVVGWR